MENVSVKRPREGAQSPFGAQKRQCTQVKLHAGGSVISQNPPVTASLLGLPDELIVKILVDVDADPIGLVFGLGMINKRLNDYTKSNAFWQHQSPTLKAATPPIKGYFAKSFRNRLELMDKASWREFSHLSGYTTVFQGHGDAARDDLPPGCMKALWGDVVHKTCETSVETVTQCKEAWLASFDHMYAYLSRNYSGPAKSISLELLGNDANLLRLAVRAGSSWDLKLIPELQALLNDDEMVNRLETSPEEVKQWLPPRSENRKLLLRAVSTDFRTLYYLDANMYWREHDFLLAAAQNYYDEYKLNDFYPPDGLPAYETVYSPIRIHAHPFELLAPDVATNLLLCIKALIITPDNMRFFPERSRTCSVIAKQVIRKISSEDNRIRKLFAQFSPLVFQHREVIQKLFDRGLHFFSGLPYAVRDTEELMHPFLQQDHRVYNWLGASMLFSCEALVRLVHINPRIIGLLPHGLRWDGHVTFAASTGFLKNEKPFLASLFLEHCLRSVPHHAEALKVKCQIDAMIAQVPAQAHAEMQHRATLDYNDLCVPLGVLEFSPALKLISNRPPE